MDGTLYWTMPPNSPVLILPGLYNSGPDHWQSHWEAAHGYRRVRQDCWLAPRCSDWMQRLERAVTELRSPPVLVAHSTACALVAHWCAVHHRTVRGALLVAPSDTEAATYPSGPIGFAPMPLYRFSFASIVVASTNDPAVRFERARFFAESWGSEFVNAGAAGHIEPQSGYGPWPEGHRLLEKLLRIEHLSAH